MGKLVKAVLFDALGTLIELKPPWLNLRDRLRERFGVEYSENHCRQALRAEIAYYKAHCVSGANEAALGNLRRECAAVLRDELPGDELLDLDLLTEVLLGSLGFAAYSEVPGVLEDLRGRGLKLAVVSNWDYQLPIVLEQLGLRDYFAAVVTSAEFGAGKPSPAIFAHALQSIDVEPAAAVHVGDSLGGDVAGALNAGVEAVFLDRSRSNEAQIPAGVAVIFSLAELAGAVPKIAAASPGRGL